MVIGVHGLFDFLEAGIRGRRFTPNCRGLRRCAVHPLWAPKRSSRTAAHWEFTVLPESSRSPGPIKPCFAEVLKVADF